MPLMGFEPTISAGERPQTHALDRADPGNGVAELLCANQPSTLRQGSVTGEL